MCIRDRIIIYPCINLVLMREDVLKLLQSFGEDGDEEGNACLLYTSQTGQLSLEKYGGVPA